MEETLTPTDHDLELKELFEKCTAAIPGYDNIRVINYSGFLVAINAMMDKAYYMGTKHSYDTVDAVLGSFLK